MAEKISNKNDLFANIASSGINMRDGSLYEPTPSVLEEKHLKTDKYSEELEINFPKKMESFDELQQELAIQRKKYEEFLQNLSPDIENFRSRIALKEFDFRIETEEDLRDANTVFEGRGSWERVTIPHYGGPLGKAVTYYRNTFILDKEFIDRRGVFICFKGVDYKAHVFINNAYVGSHEGFFAPFEFDCTERLRTGENTIIIKVENDYICMGSISEKSEGKQFFGDKIYAATGPGYDDPQFGWHHCPPGMGIYQDVYIESRPRVFVNDLFVQPEIEKSSAKAWLEVYSCDIEPKDISVELSLFGKNFKEEVFKGVKYTPSTSREIGMGDSFTEAKLRASGEIDKPILLYMEKGMNFLKIPFNIKNFKLWELDKPFLYQLQIKLIDKNGNTIDTFQRHFGMRSFEMDTVNVPKGKMFLNGKPIRLRGANTMGHEQQCVMKNDFKQLIDDILLAKICNMNFLRLTQRPVQEEIYTYCDMLGLMTQTDLPLFGVLRRNQFCEAVRQAEEMEKLIRWHPCNVLVSYINEPFPNAFNKPHRHLNREELNKFFTAADLVIKLNNPDRVIKHVDGDYDPPSESLPDNHCYPAWYNGHGIDIGKLNKGYWLPVKKDWFYGCGEFGAEGLDFIDVMKKYYPKDWLPQNEKEESDWFPNKIVGSQTGNFHYFFYDTPNSLNNWVLNSHKHQAWATKFMTEAFRRNSMMNTFAIHLFIDAFPSGWMKTIMDVDRKPKPAYFAYRDALTPTMISIRTDRYKFFEGEEGSFELWVCNDKNESNKLLVYYELEYKDKILFNGQINADIIECDSKFQGFVKFNMPLVEERTELTLRAAIVDENRNVLHYNTVNLEVFPNNTCKVEKKICVIGDNNCQAMKLINELQLDLCTLNDIKENDVILVDDYTIFTQKLEEIRKIVENGAKIIFLELPQGDYDIFDTRVEVKMSSMLPMHFVSRNTRHALVENFKEADFKHWYDPEKGYIAPILESTFNAKDMEAILVSGNTNHAGEWGIAMAAAGKKYGNGYFYINQIKLPGRISTNPIAKLFAQGLIF